MGRVIGISDGDTLTVLVDQQPLKVRLADIDAPEKKQAFGTRAKQTLSDLIYDKTVTLTVLDTDRYGRSVAQVDIDGQNTNQQMVSAGMAWCYRKYLRDQGCIALETTAREARSGLWTDPHPVPPWEWRKAQRRP